MITTTIKRDTFILYGAFSNQKEKNRYCQASWETKHKQSLALIYHNIKVFSPSRVFIDHDTAENNLRLCVTSDAVGCKV